jgi:hypothetical protein
MFKFNRKLLAGFLLFTYLFFVRPTDSHAVLPVLAVPFIASAIIHVAAVAGLYYWMTSGSKSQVNTSGDVTRQSNVAWVDITGPIPMVQNKPIHAKLTKDQIEAISGQKPTTYPNLDAASKRLADGSMAAYGDYTVGTQFSYGGKTYKVTGAGSVPGDPLGPHWEDYQFSGVGSGLTYTYTSDYGGHYKATITQGTGQQYRYYQLQAVPDPQHATYVYAQTVMQVSNTYRPSTAQELASTLAANGTSGDVNTAYQAELDKMMQDPSYVGTFTDDSTGLPFAAPPLGSVMSPEAVQAYNDAAAAKNAAEAAAINAADVANAAKTNAATALANAQAAQSAAQSAYNADPSAANKGALDQANRDLAAAQGAYDGASSAAATAGAAAAAATAANTPGADVTKDTGTINSGAPSAYPSDGAYDFGARLNQFFTALKGSALFGVANFFPGGMPTSSQSVISLDCGSWGVKTYDLENLSGAWAAMRVLIQITASITAIYIITLKGGSG